MIFWFERFSSKKCSGGYKKLQAEEKIEIAEDGFEPSHLVHETNKLTVTLSRAWKNAKPKKESAKPNRDPTTPRPTIATFSVGAESCDLLAVSFEKTM